MPGVKAPPSTFVRRTRRRSSSADGVEVGDAVAVGAEDDGGPVGGPRGLHVLGPVLGERAHASRRGIHEHDVEPSPGEKARGGDLVASRAPARGRSTPCPPPIRVRARTSFPSMPDQDQLAPVSPLPDEDDRSARPARRRDRGPAAPCVILRTRPVSTSTALRSLRTGEEVAHLRLVEDDRPAVGRPREARARRCGPRGGDPRGRPAARGGWRESASGSGSCRRSSSRRG